MRDKRKATDSSARSTYHYFFHETVCYEQSYGKARCFEYSNSATMQTQMLLIRQHNDQLTLQLTQRPALFLRRSHVESYSSRQHNPNQNKQRKARSVCNPPSQSLSASTAKNNQNIKQRRSATASSSDHSAMITIARALMQSIINQSHSNSKTVNNWHIQKCHHALLTASIDLTHSQPQPPHLA
jgi:hypothetical protein